MIRQATPEDFDWIREIAIEVYAPFGDYGNIIPTWLTHKGMLTYLDMGERGTRRGFILLGFYEPEDAADDATYIADLLAIGVASRFQGTGVGRRLLEYAIDLAGLAGHRVPVPEIRLTVADTNVRARNLFARCGFEVLDEEHGAYDGGQRAIRMRRRMEPQAR
mgnify:CR=1 FL=1